MTSLTEAKYMGAAEVVKEAIWFRTLLKELGYFQDNEIIIMYEDNQGCINLANNPTNHSKLKHIDINYHFVRDKVKEEQIELVYCRTEDMVADMIMKSVSRDKLWKFYKKLGLRLCIQSRSITGYHS